MALIAVCLTVTFVIRGRANEGPGEQSERGRDAVAGEGGERGGE